MLLKFVLLFAVFFIDAYSGCCKDNSKIKTINCEENKKSISLGLWGGGNDELVQKDASAVNDTIDISEIPIINDHSNGLQAKQISDIREDFYGYSYKILPCLSYRDKFDLLYVLAGSQFDQELHKVFIEKVVELLDAGKILRFCKSTGNAEYNAYNSKYHDAYGAFCSYENVIWFFDIPTIVRELGVNLQKRRLLLKCLNDNICYFNVLSDKRYIDNVSDGDYNFDFKKGNFEKYIGEYDNEAEVVKKLSSLKFDLSPEALFK